MKSTGPASGRAEPTVAPADRPPLDPATRSKYKDLKERLRSMGSVLVAYSGGVDSTLLLKVAVDVLGDRVLAVSARSPTFPESEYALALELAKQMGARHETVKTEELENPEFANNPSNRCFFCKTELFGVLTRMAHGHGLEQVVEGSNADDTKDFRPGLDAARKLGVRSPLMEAGMTKDEIRTVAAALELPNWNKPSAACLASRIPYGEQISEPRLRRIELAEEAVRSMGIRQVRVRDHGQVARIEIPADDMDRLLDPAVRRELVQAVKQAGYAYVSVDLEGYRSGAMNEPLFK